MKRLKKKWLMAQKIIVNDMVLLNFLGGMSEVGRSGIQVETKTENIVLDYGTKIQEIPPKFPLPVKKPDAVILSHCHLDHCGGIPIFFKTNSFLPIYSIDVTKPLVELLLLDSLKVSREEGVELPFTKQNVEKTVKSFLPKKYHKKFQIGKTKITFYDAGHIPGSAMTLLEVEGKNILYTGDLNVSNTRLIKGADRDLPKIDILITESTYSDREHPNRKSQEKELIRIIEDTLSADGICLVAGFAVGRIDELLLVLDAYGIDYPLYIDGMAKKAITIINQYKNLLRVSDSLDRALEKTEYVKDERMRKRIIRDPCVILTTGGMLSGGPIVWYIKKLYNRKNCSLVLTSYQIEGTPGRTLLQTGNYINPKVNLNLKLSMFVQKLDFSTHLGRSELFSFIKRIDPEKIFCIHGDHTEDFSAELRDRGYDAYAPLATNRTFRV